MFKIAIYQQINTYIASNGIDTNISYKFKNSKSILYLLCNF